MTVDNCTQLQHSIPQRCVDCKMCAALLLELCRQVNVPGCEPCEHLMPNMQTFQILLS